MACQSVCVRKLNPFQVDQRHRRLVYPLITDEHRRRLREGTALLPVTARKVEENAGTGSMC